MTGIPDFSNVAFVAFDRRREMESCTPRVIQRGGPGRLAPPEGITVKSSTVPRIVPGLDFLDTYPGLPPYLRGPYPRCT